MPDPLALRVARRHRAAIVSRDAVFTKTKVRVEYDCSGKISMIDLKLMIEPQVGYLMKLRFRPSLVGTPTTVGWEGVKVDGELVTGKLVLHALVSEGEVRSWGEVVVDR
jgi:hypothetical protein